MYYVLGVWVWLAHLDSFESEIKGNIKLSDNGTSEM